MKVNVQLIEEVFQLMSESVSFKRLQTNLNSFGKNKNTATSKGNRSYMRSRFAAFR